MAIILWSQYLFLIFTFLPRRIRARIIFEVAPRQRLKFNLVIFGIKGNTSLSTKLHLHIMAPSISQDSFGAGSGNTTSLNSFHNLVSDLSRILGPSSGLNSEEVDVQELFRLMENYISSEKEWSKYAFSDLSRGYTRNLVDEGNGKSNLVSLISKFHPAIIWLCFQ